MVSGGGQALCARGLRAPSPLLSCTLTAFILLFLLLPPVPEQERGAGRPPRALQLQPPHAGWRLLRGAGHAGGAPGTQARPWDPPGCSTGCGTGSGAVGVSPPGVTTLCPAGPAVGETEPRGDPVPHPGHHGQARASPQRGESQDQGDARREARPGPAPQGEDGRFAEQDGRSAAEEAGSPRYPLPGPSSSGAAPRSPPCRGAAALAPAPWCQPPSVPSQRCSAMRTS